jgi:acyl dehydratase
MSLNLRVVGERIGPFEHLYSWKDVALYALSLGAGPGELPLLIEPAPLVLPTYAVVPAFAPVHEALQRLGVDLQRVLHASQRVEQLRPLPSSGCLLTTAVVRGVYDMRIGAMVDIETLSSVGDEPYARTVWSLLVLGLTGIDGGKAPPLLRARAPKDAVPDVSHTWTTSPAQALLYRLNGDINPIHALPEAAATAGLEAPILHGLCTYGYLARVALKALTDYQPVRFRSFEARFSKPVLPGQTLAAELFRIGPASFAITARITETGEMAVTNAQLDLEE